MVAVLGAETNGIYFNDSRVTPYCIDRDLRTYKGPHKVICHTPCKRWGRFWGGGPMLHGTDRQLLLGDDGGLFAHGLWCTRSFGGVMEHPEASHAFKWFGLPIPSIHGEWTDRDRYGGASCCVAQGHYGHRAQKFTWLYAVGTKRPELKWGKSPNKMPLSERSIHSVSEGKMRRKQKGYKPEKRISAKENAATPLEFKELLIGLVN